jgi:uroporphyrinogen-III synthase
MQRLTGQRIALFESRLAAELSHLVWRSGGVPVCVPAVRERRRPAAAEVASLLVQLQGEPRPVFVLSTGVGTSALFDEARALGRGAELRDALVRGVTVCRGPKPVTALHRDGVKATIKARPPYTSADLIETLAGVEVRGRMTVLVHYGERNEALVDALLERIVEELVGGEVAAAAFTTQVQGRNLLAIADRMRRRTDLLEALQDRVMTAAVGPTCARVLGELGIAAQVVPQTPKMGAMLSALVDRLALRERR